MLPKAYCIFSYIGWRSSKHFKSYETSALIGERESSFVMVTRSLLRNVLCPCQQYPVTSQVTIDVSINGQFDNCHDSNVRNSGLLKREKIIGVAALDRSSCNWAGFKRTQQIREMSVRSIWNKVGWKVGYGYYWAGNKDLRVISLIAAFAWMREIAKAQQNAIVYEKATSENF